MHLSNLQKQDNVQLIISQILSAANSEVNLDELFKYIHNSIEKLMPAKNFYIALFDKEKNFLSFPYFIDEFEQEAPPQEFGKGLTEYVIKNGQSYLVDEELSNKLFEANEIELVGEPSKIWLGVPLKIQNYVVGAFVVQDYQDCSIYTEKEKEILEIISYPVARAIERKIDEQEREALISKLKDLNEFKDRLFSLISHDLRGPFNSLLGFSEILTTEYDSLTEDEKKEYLNAIYESSKNLYNMTNNLLQFSRYQMGRIEFHPNVIELNPAISQCLNMLKGNILKKQLNIFTSVPNNFVVTADEDMLNSIFQNLVSNAIKFTPRGGDIFITAKKADSTDKEMIEVSIRDSGVGMDEETLQHIFTNNISSTPGTEKEYGTGLGMMLTKDFIDRLGGAISVKSKLNEGTNFILQLPKA